MDEYTLTIQGSVNGAALQVTDPDGTVVYEANDLTEYEAAVLASTWIHRNATGAE